MAAAAPLRAALRLSTTKKIARTFGATAPPLPPPEGLASAKINTTATNHPIPSSRNLGKAIKDTGRELRQVALTEDCVSDVQNALYSVHRTVVPLSKTMHPVINGNDIFIAPNSSIIGDVFVGEGTGVWYGAVVRGDLSKVTIGAKVRVALCCGSTSKRLFSNKIHFNIPIPIINTVQHRRQNNHQHGSHFQRRRRLGN